MSQPALSERISKAEHARLVYEAFTEQAGRIGQLKLQLAGLPGAERAAILHREARSQQKAARRAWQRASEAAEDALAARKQQLKEGRPA